MCTAFPASRSGTTGLRPGRTVAGCGDDAVKHFQRMLGENPSLFSGACPQLAGSNLGTFSSRTSEPGNTAALSVNPLRGELVAQVHHHIT